MFMLITANQTAYFQPTHYFITSNLSLKEPKIEI